MPARIVLVFALNVLVGLPSLLCQTGSPPAVEPNKPVIHSTTREVLLDLVVRDKHQHPVTDLRPEEVEVYEDGVRQNLRVFRNIRGSEQLATERSAEGASNSTQSAQPATNEAPHPLNSMRQVNFVSVVFAEIA